MKNLPLAFYRPRGKSGINLRAQAFNHERPVPAAYDDIALMVRLENWK